jgi:tetratricopeptide (TPR) repeat protein
MLTSDSTAHVGEQCILATNSQLLNRLPLAAVLALSTATAHPQAAPKAAAPTVQQAIAMVETGKCPEALPVLKRSLPHVTDKELRYHAEMALVRCAMALDDEEAAADTLIRLRHDSPGDPEVLYIATHYFSELGMRASQELESTAPASFQARKLQAESLESQGKNDEAAAIYRKILEDDPKTPGIHYRLGQIDLAIAGPSGSTADAKAEFQKEIEIDPTNAAAHFIVGELARRNNEWDEAIQEFSRAAKLDVGFSEAYLALGMSLAASGKYADAVPPLQSYVKMQPDDPAGHYQLAMAYSRTGNKDGATRELALQTKAANARAATDTAEGHSIHP